MKVFLSLLFFFFLPLSAFAAEKITDFSSDIDLSTDGTFVVTEQITYDFGTNEKHGIYRFLEHAHPQQSASLWKKKHVEYNIESVLMDAEEIPYTISDSQKESEIKIGDPKKTITGVHTYTITYDVSGGLSYFDDSTAEIYWNVTGNGWEVPIEKTVAKIHPHGVTLLQKHACYEGAYGSSQRCDSITIDDEGLIVFTSGYLTATEALTIAQALSDDKLTYLVHERYNFALAFLIASFLFLGGVTIWAYRYKTQYKSHRSIVAQYEPYKNYKPMYSGVLLDGKLDTSDITAGIMYLAQQGYIKIKKIEKKVFFLFDVNDYEITLLKTSGNLESDFLKSILELIFSPEAVILSSKTLGVLKVDTQKLQQNSNLLNSLRNDLKKDMRASGFFETNSRAPYMIAIIVVVLIGTVFSAGVLLAYVPVLFVSITIFLLACFIISITLLERRTQKGYEVQDYLKGFKLFLSVTDKERFAFHDAPKKSPEQFMEYLPYAIAFGVEKQWAEVFKGITIPNPGWYDGGDIGTFSAINLTISLGAFSTSLAASTASSSTGGSSGGGFSGGGGGGGGGGSW